MAKTVFKPSSATATLTVLSVPKGTITSINYPSEVFGGGSFNVTGSVRNDGGYGYLIIQLLDRDTGATVDEKDLGSFDAGQSKNFSLYAVMPNKDWNLRTRVGHWEYDPGTGRDIWKTDHQADFSVTLLIAISTSLSLGSFPQVQPGENYAYGGRLTRADTGAGLSGQTIRCDRQEGGVWKELATASTDANGYYSKSVAAPTTPGSYPCRTRYMGTPGYFFSLAEEVYRGSVSPVRNLAVVGPFPLALTLLPLALGTGMALAGRVWD